jgi:hypothetical protein
MDYYLGKKPKGIYHFLLLNSLCINNIFTRKLFRYYSDFIRLILKGKKLEISASESFILNNENIDSIFKNSNIIKLSGWKIRSWDLFLLYENEIRKLLFPDSIYYKNAQNYIQKIRQKHQIIIGVLVRQTDYRVFLDGKYFFESNQYKNWLQQLNEIYKNQNIAFLIAADEKQDFSEFENVYFGSGYGHKKDKYAEDMFELSLCDLIVSPPSTFSGLAAFLGQKNILPLSKNEQILSLNDCISGGLYEMNQHVDFSLAVN